MNIYTAASSIKRVFTYMMETSDFNGDGTRGLYRCTKDRLRLIYDMCEAIMNAIAPILDYEVVEEPADIHQAKLNEIRKTLEDKPTEAVLDKPGKPMPDGQIAENPDHATSTTSMSNKNILKQYDMAFTFPVENFGPDAPEEVTEIYTLLKDWFRTRFHTAMGRNCPFRYNITQIPIWMNHIILTACSAYKQGTFDKYKHYFNEWLTSLKETHHRYAVPANVYFSMKQYTHDDIRYRCPSAYPVYSAIYDRIFDGFLDDYGTKSPTYPDEFGYYHLTRDDCRCSSQALRDVSGDYYECVKYLRKDYIDVKD